MSRHPEVLWAQRSSESAPEKNIIYLTINLPDIAESSLEYVVTATALSFKATAGSSSTEQLQYAFDLELFSEVDPEKCVKRLTSRSLVAVLRKKELKSEFWPRLTKEKIKTPFIKTDFSKWVDEDEQDGKPEPEEPDFSGGIPGMDGMDFSKLPADFGGDDTPPTRDFQITPEDLGLEESDDEPPPLEDPESAK